MDQLHNIKTDGFIIVKVMEEKQATQYFKALKTFVSHHQLSPTIGIIKTNGIGQAAFMWKLRNLRTVKRAFASILNCKQKDLVTSMDGAFYSEPHASHIALWPHRDQRPSNNNLETYQGVLSLTDSDGSFVYWPKTHTKKWNYTASEMDTDFFRLDDNNISINKHKSIRIPPGHLLIFDSRLVHCNQVPIKKTRAVAYICMVDGRGKMTREITERRQYCMDNNKTTSHHPLKFTF